MRSLKNVISTTSVICLNKEDISGLRFALSHKESFSNELEKRALIDKEVEALNAIIDKKTSKRHKKGFNVYF